MTLTDPDLSDLSEMEKVARFCAATGTSPAEFVALLPAQVEADLSHSWTEYLSRPSQRLPGGNWKLWFIRAGRGAGKTRTGSEAVRRVVKDGVAGRIGLISPTAGDARDVMVEGESGILAVHPPGHHPHYEPSKRRITWPNGAMATLYSAEEPERLRGPQHDFLWGDEPASWKYGEQTWDNAMFGLRLGKHPRTILTGTPRPLPWLRALEDRADTVVTTASTYRNMANLAPAFIDMILTRYEGTRLGQQELHAMYLDDVEGALWTLAVIEAARIGRFDRTNPWRSLSAELTRVRTALGQGLVTFTPAEQRRRWVTYVAVDPPGETAECGIVAGTAPAYGKAGRDHAIVLDDMSITGPPEVWGPQVAACARKWEADKVIVEANQGGDMTRAAIHAQDPDLVVEKIRAKYSKADRAEPISVLDARGWVHHMGTLPALENQMTTWVPTEGKSPDRIDARVHLLTALLEPTPVGRAVVLNPNRARRRAS